MKRSQCLPRCLFQFPCVETRRALFDLTRRASSAQALQDLRHEVQSRVNPLHIQNVQKKGCSRQDVYQVICSLYSSGFAGALMVAQTRFLEK